MGEQPLQSFIDLVQFDQSLHRVERNIELLEQEQKKINQHVKTLQKNIELVRYNEREVRKEVDACELRLKELDAKEKEKKQYLEDASTPREYKILKTELETIHAQQHESERLLMQLINKSETAQKERDEQDIRYEQRLAELEGEYAEKEAKVKELRSFLNASSQDRSSKERHVPEEWLEKYAGMKNIVSDPVVALEQESCSGCFYPLSAQDVISLRRNALIQCKNCYRFVFYKPEE